MIIITSVKSIEGGGYRVNGKWLVPNDEANRFYIAVQAWIAEGNTPEAADVPKPPTVQEKRRLEIERRRSEILDALLKNDTAGLATIDSEIDAAVG